jgi:hypothetical protein
MELQLIKKVNDFLVECIANHGRKFNGLAIANKHGLSRAAWDAAESLFFVTEGKQKKSKLAKVMPIHARELINKLNEMGARIEFTYRPTLKDISIRHNIMTSALESMPGYFNSLEFSATCRQMGLDKGFIKTGGTALFLHQNAKQGETNKMWYKLNNTPESIATRQQINSTAQQIAPATEPAQTQATGTAQQKTQQELTEQQCIDFLKERGYKIYKTITVEL